MSDGVKIDTSGLTSLLKALKKPPTIKVGILILGSNSARTEGFLNNATIGAKHEFGLDGMPIRSFLRVPIATNLEKELDNAGMFNEKSINNVIKEKSFKNFSEKVAIAAEAVVLKSFDTGGDGKWKPSDMRYKKIKQTLVETQQLRNSITSEVKDSE